MNPIDDQLNRLFRAARQHFAARGHCARQAASGRSRFGHRRHSCQHGDKRIAGNCSAAEQPDSCRAAKSNRRARGHFGAGANTGSTGNESRHSANGKNRNAACAHNHELSGRRRHKP